ncbi:MAG: hypothetical protein LH615_03215, partial [Ferruginibacter sp.]|nr:hypothetical protein [Ferruginibacter sp.]
TAISACQLNQFLTAILSNMRFISFVKYRKGLSVICVQTLYFPIIVILPARHTVFKYSFLNN